MKKILLTRHAKTEPFQFSKPDFERKLVPRGFKDIDLVSKFLIDQEQIPQQFFYSPALRTTQTADRFAENFRADTDASIPMSTVEDLYMAHVEDIDNLIYGLHDELDTVMIIGHNPSMMDYLLRQNRVQNMPTTATAVFSSDVQKWSSWGVKVPELEFYISPKMLK